jgi:TRAP transporter TAXI family solute receptor
MKIVRSAFSAALALCLVGIAAGPAAAQKSSITLGSTNSTSSHYAVAVAMSKAIKEAMPNTNVSVIETGASVDNVRRLSRGEIDIGLVAVDTGIQAVSGTGSIQGRAVKDLAAVYTYDASILNIAVRVDSNVKTLKDLHGKKFNAGIRGSGAEMLTREAFTILGIEPAWAPGSVKDAVEGIQNRQIVGYAKYGPGIGIDATLRELLTSTEMRLIGFTEDERKQIESRVKGVGFTTIPENLFPGQPAVTTPLVPIVYAARTGEMDDATAHAIAKAIYENRRFLIETWPHLKDFDFKAQALGAEKLGLPLHPGAKRFWESVK